MTATRRACEDAGCHDFTDPVTMLWEGRKWTLLWGDRVAKEATLSICRRCGIQITAGWDVGDEETK